MKETWDSLIGRAERLASEKLESKELLTFYAALLRSQKAIYDYLRTRKGWLPSGELEQDLAVLRVMIPGFLHAVESSGTDALASQARSLIETRENELDAILIEHWRSPVDLQFFPKAFLQPYACWLSEIGAKPLSRNLGAGENRCPFCEGKPQVSVLLITEASSESSGRHLVCATCLTRWPFRRVVCASCGEENPAKIGYYHAREYDHVRVEACDTCNHYIKTVDLTRFGFAVPLVDEVAAAPLDLWAREHGYAKIEMNLVGL
jgi:formate dehydrogenase accessory protein FdhE